MRAAQLKEQCPIKAPVAEFNIPALSKQLRTETAWRSKQRNSVTVFKSNDLHIVLVAMHAVTLMPGHKVDVPLTIQVLEGRIRVITGKDKVAVNEGGLLVLEAGISHDVEAIKESVFLLTLAIGRAGVSAPLKSSAPEVWGG